MFGCELYAVCPNQMLQTNSYSMVDGATVSKLIQIYSSKFYLQYYNIQVNTPRFAFLKLNYYLIFRTKNVLKGTRNVLRASVQVTVTVTKPDGTGNTINLKLKDDGSGGK